MEPALHVVLYQPEIPGNTGNAGRLCLGLRLRLHVVHPIPFSIDEKAVRRAGLLGVGCGQCRCEEIVRTIAPTGRIPSA